MIDFEKFNIQNCQLKKLCQYYDLSYYTEDINSYTDEEWDKL